MKIEHYVYSHGDNSVTVEHYKYIGGLGISGKRISGIGYILVF